MPKNRHYKLKRTKNKKSKRNNKVKTRRNLKNKTKNGLAKGANDTNQSRETHFKLSHKEHRRMELQRQIIELRTQLASIQSRIFEKKDFVDSVLFEESENEQNAKSLEVLEKEREEKFGRLQHLLTKLNNL